MGRSTGTDQRRARHAGYVGRSVQRHGPERPSPAREGATAAGVATLHHVELAWRLAMVTNAHLSARERNEIYVAVGAGDTYTAIRKSTAIAARKHVEVPAAIKEAVERWWAAHEDATDDFGQLIAGLRTRPRAAARPTEPKYLTVNGGFRPRSRRNGPRN